MTGANVTILNNSDVIPLSEQEPGHYYTDSDVYGLIGERYELHIELSNGENYEAITYIQNISENLGTDFQNILMIQRRR